MKRDVGMFLPHPSRALLVTILVLTALSASWCPAHSANKPVIPDESILIYPAADYPDPQELKNISGTVTVTFRAGGSYTFREDYNAEKDLAKQVKLEMVMTIQCQHGPKSEVVHVDVQGSKITTEEAPARGQKKFGYNYWPSLKRSVKETYRGTSVQQYNGRAINSYTWSKALKVVSFKAELGGEPGWPTVYITTPVKMHVEKEESHDDQTERESYDSDTQFMAYIPACGTSSTRWAVLVKKPKNQIPAFGWIESASPNGGCSGSVTWPAFFKNFHWDCEGIYLQSDTDPRKAPEYAEDIIWPGTVQVVWTMAPAGK